MMCVNVVGHDWVSLQVKHVDLTNVMTTLTLCNRGHSEALTLEHPNSIGPCISVLGSDYRIVCWLGMVPAMQWRPSCSAECTRGLFLMMIQN